MKLYGIFIGIDEYQDSRISRLGCAKRDAEVFYNLFNANLAPAQRELFLLMDKNASKINILKLIGEDISRLANEDDLVIIHFSGHGTPETAGSLDEVSRYIVSYDTEYDSIYATALDVERELPRLFERIQAKIIVLSVDACFSGKVGGRTFEGPHLFKKRTKFREAINLKTMDLGSGRIMIAAADQNEVAVEEPAFNHGVFTYYLIQALTDPNYHNQTIGVGRLYENVAQNVRRYTRGRQNPVMNGRSTLAQLPIMRGLSSLA